MRTSSAGLCVALAAALLLADLDARQHADRADAAAGVTFREAARASGIDFTHHNGASDDKHLAEIVGSGGLFLDIDADGWIDILLVDGGSMAAPGSPHGARHRLFRNRGNGTFLDVTEGSGITHREYGMGACAADYDNDGFVDVHITNAGPNVLYRNNGDGTFTDVSATAGTATALWSTSCAFADVDRDGHADLFVTNYVVAGHDHNPFCGNARPALRVYCHPLNFDPLPNTLYRNNGDGTFTDVTDAAGLASYRGNGLGVVVLDAEADGWPDVFVANDALPDFLFRNLGAGRFEEVGLVSGVAVAADGQARAGMGTAAGDYDGDGRLDLVVTNHEHEMHSLFRNVGDALFEDATIGSRVGPATLPYVGFGVAFVDYDNDGRLDLAIANGHVIDNIAMFRKGASHAQPNVLLRNMGGGRFTDVTRLAGDAFALSRVSRLLATGDIDNDGDQDVLVTNNGGPADLLINEGGSRQHALLVHTVGTTANRDGIGARLTLTAGGRTQVREVGAGSSYLGQHDRRVHFGLGSLTTADRLEVWWPSGHTDVVRRPPVDHIITIREGEGMTAHLPFTGHGRRSAP